MVLHNLDDRFYCPACGKIFLLTTPGDAVYKGDGKGAEAGDVGFCAACLRPLVFEAANRVRKMTPAEWDKLDGEEQAAMLAMGVGEPE